MNRCQRILDYLGDLQEMPNTEEEQSAFLLPLTGVELADQPCGFRRSYYKPCPSDGHYHSTRVSTIKKLITKRHDCHPSAYYVLDYEQDY